MEKKDLLKFPIHHLDLTNTEGVDQLLWGFEAASFQSCSVAKPRTVLRNTTGDEDSTVFLGIAGAFMPGDLSIARIKLKPKNTGASYIGGTTPKHIENPKWGGLSGCICRKAQPLGTTAKAAPVTTVYRQRFRIAALCERVYAIQ